MSNNNTTVKEDTNPYRGIESYQKEHHKFFWGRDCEIRQITNAILHNGNTILTGYSGCGKTSLINAGLLPELELVNYHLITITPRSVFDSENENNFVFNFWKEVSTKIDDEVTKYNQIYEKKIVAYDNKETLFEKLYTPNLFIDADENPHYFVISIDQFEELFQLNLNLKHIERMFKIYRILCGSYFPNFDEIKDIISFKHPTKDAKGDIVPMEYSTNKIFPSNEKVYSSLKNNISDNRFILSIRKDYLFDIETYSHKYSFLGKNIHYVKYLDDDQARLVIRGSSLFKKMDEKENQDKEKLKRILECLIKKTDFDAGDDIPDYRVDTMMLSIVMHELWEKTNHDEMYIQNLGLDKLQDNVKLIIQNFYYEKIIELKKYLLNVIISNCTNDIVKYKLYQNIEKIIYELEYNLISGNGLYRLPVYLYDISMIFGNYIYGEIDFKFTEEKLRNNYLKDILNNLKIKDDDVTKCIKRLQTEMDKINNEHLVIDNKMAIKLRDIFDDTVYGSCIVNNEQIQIITAIKNYIRAHCLFIPLSRGGEVEEIEFRHDELCKWALEHMKQYEIWQKNAMRYTADFYFTPMGRLKHDNCYIEPVFGPWNTYSAVQRTVFFMEGGISEMLYFDTTFIDKCMDINNKGAQSMIVTLDIKKTDKFNNENTELDSPELFSQIKVKVVHKKIYEISFFRDGVPVMLPSGFHKVVFYYDDYGRIIIKRFYEDYDKTKLANFNGYNSIFYKYTKDYHKLPDITYYTNLEEDEGIMFNHIEKENKKIYIFKAINPIDKKYLGSHSDGNYGYVSYYDEYGRETTRVFLFEDNGKWEKGFDTIKFHKDYNKETKITENHNNLIKAISYYSGGVNVSYKDKGDNYSQSLDYFDINKCEPYHYNGKVHKVEFGYDSQNRIIDTYYYDANDINVDIKGRYGEKYDYEYAENDNLYIKSTYQGKISNSDKRQREATPDADGIEYALMHRSIYPNHIDSIEWGGKKIKENRSLLFNNKLYKFNKIEFKRIGDKIYVHYALKNTTQLVLKPTGERIKGVIICSSMPDNDLITDIKSILPQKGYDLLSLDDLQEKGQTITELQRSFKEFKIYICVLFNKKYAQSFRCMREFVKIQDILKTQNETQNETQNSQNRKMYFNKIELNFIDYSDFIGRDLNSYWNIWQEFSKDKKIKIKIFKSDIDKINKCIETISEYRSGNKHLNREKNVTVMTPQVFEKWMNELRTVNERPKMDYICNNGLNQSQNLDDMIINKVLDYLFG